jgi:hypothetical protein
MLRRCLTLVSDDLYKRSGNDGIFYYLDGLDRVRYYFVNYYDAHKKETDDIVTVEAEYQDIAKLPYNYHVQYETNKNIFVKNEEYEVCPIILGKEF